MQPRIYLREGGGGFARAIVAGATGPACEFTKFDDWNVAMYTLACDGINICRYQYKQ